MATETHPRTFFIEVPSETQRKILNIVPHVPFDSQTDEDILGILLKNLSGALPYTIEIPSQSNTADKTSSCPVETVTSQPLRSKSLLANSVIHKLSRQCSEKSLRSSPQPNYQKVQNILDLCLLCAQVPKDGHLINIFGHIGKSLKLLEKIHRYLTITIEEGFPIKVCIPCIGKLNVCHELVQNSEVAYKKLQKFRDVWELQQQKRRVEVHIEDDTTVANTAPCPVAIIDFRFQEELKVDDSLASDLDTIEDLSAEPDVAENGAFEVQATLLVKSSQTVYLLAEDNATELNNPRISLIVINMDINLTDYEQKIKEKLCRIKKTNFKLCSTKNENMVCDDENTNILSNTLTFACQICKYSFFNEEQLLFHFKSLHPTQISKCSRCNISICGTKEEIDNHTDNCLSDTNILLKTLISDTVRDVDQLDPEYIIIPLGSLEHNGCLPLSKVLCEIERNKFIKPHIKKEINNALANFKFKFTKSANILCHVCGKYVCTKDFTYHMEYLHAPEEINYCDIANVVRIEQHEVSNLLYQCNNGHVFI